MSPRGRGVASLLALALVAVLAAPAAGSGPTGSRRGIALFRIAATATNALPAYLVTQRGYVRISDSLGPHRRVHWAWGWAQHKPGFHPATERLVLVQHDGRTVWMRDILTPTAASCRTSCALPIELLITRSIAFDGLVSSGASATCFQRVGLAHVPYPAGGPWWAAFGDLSAPTSSGTLTEITSRFATGPQQVTESDWLHTSSHLFARSVVHVAAGGGRPAFSYASTDTRLAKVPGFPTVTLCS